MQINYKIQDYNSLFFCLLKNNEAYSFGFTFAGVINGKNEDIE